MAMRDQDRVVVRLSVEDRRELDTLRGPVGRASFLRTLLRRAAVEAEDGDRDDALASFGVLAEHDDQVGRVQREIEMRDGLERLRLLPGTSRPRRSPTPLGASWRAAFVFGSKRASA